ncbi:Oxygen-dependent choline dehydrogenase [Seminavis robusta]|uniref:Oxygen-dependent choline dehydrogenase n=1 Tax=Seminavis robusta TaxID=568900 RepID=A0A9N8ENI8_9STRA|nr:Oxygen-dependent choline dehydrogenase [Seminavis robusta]|eukprot:Sro1433_g272200.1 Oxygen-dependent choline dehydrogenase (628) ;mRNA; f:6101-8070
MVSSFLLAAHQRSLFGRKWTVASRFVSTATTQNTANADNPDYVVAGAGSAGSVIASRLAQAGKSVTLLEAGHSDRSGHVRDLFIHMPTALAWPMSSPRYNWGFGVEPAPALGGRVISCPRGKGLGGSSSINGLVYVRGHPENFNEWQHMGADGWDYASVLPYFKKAETWAHHTNHHDDDNNRLYRGDTGPLHVKNGDNAAKTPLYDLFIKAGSEAGYGMTPDYNAQRQEGFGPMAMTVFHSGSLRGCRSSTASAYLHPAVKHHSPQLKVQTNAMIQKVIFDNQEGAKPRATGLEYLDGKTRTMQTIHANQEVILCLGSIQSPQLLQVSGIGDTSHLHQIGVTSIVHHNPHVGQNLQDHLELYFQQEVIPPISIAPVLSSYWEQLKLGIEWILTRKGLGATNQFEAAAFVRSAPTKPFPDVQFHFLPVGISYDGVTLAPSKTGHSLQIHIGASASKSRGYVKAKTADMNEQPKIQFNYMSHDEDWIDMRNAIEVARQVMRQPVLKDIVGDEIMPGKNANLDDYITEHVESAYHPCGTCRMGASQDENQAVVDPCGRVHGVDALRVVDASIFPTITNGNLNAPVIMVAERMADLILGKEPLPPVELSAGNEPWVPPENGTDRENSPMVP